MFGALFTPFKMIGTAAETCVYGQGTNGLNQRVLTEDEIATKAIKSANNLAFEILDETTEETSKKSENRCDRPRHCHHWDYSPHFWSFHPVYVFDTGPSIPRGRNNNNDDKALLGVVASVIAGVTLYCLTKDCYNAYKVEKKLDKAIHRYHIIDRSNLHNKEDLKNMLNHQVNLLKRMRDSYALGTVLKTSLLAFSVITAYTAFIGASVSLGVTGLLATSAVMIVKLVHDSATHPKFIKRLRNDAMILQDYKMAAST